MRPCFLPPAHRSVRLGSNAYLGGLRAGDGGASWAVRDGARHVALLRLASATAPTRRKPCEPIIEAIGEGFEALVALLTPWCDAIMAGPGYPGRACVERQGERARRA